MKSQFKIGALLSYVVLALQNLVGLLYTPFMLRMMGTSEYGIYSVAAALAMPLSAIQRNTRPKARSKNSTRCLECSSCFIVQSDLLFWLLGALFALMPKISLIRQ